MLEPGTLRRSVDERSRAAIACGALFPIETETEHIADGGIRFLIRVASNLKRKEAEGAARNTTPQAASGETFSPFLPPEPDLAISDISTAHFAVLNKFNVLDGHLLIVTKRFEHQEELLTEQDFDAWLACMQEYDSLGFYNAGRTAGASQVHKHLQMIPLPLTQEGAPVPIEPLLEGPGPRCSSLRFPHSFRRLKTGRSGLANAAAQAHSLYMEMLEDLGVAGAETSTAGDKSRQTHPYNLLLTKDWMLTVPRRQETFRGVSVNSLGFAGLFFVKEPDQLQVIHGEGPMRILQAVAGGP